MSDGFILDIEGENVALVSHSRLSSSVAQWASLVEVVLADQPLPGEMSVQFDPKTGRSGTNGLSLRVTHSEFLLQQRKTSPKTTLSSDYDEGVSTPISVGDTSDFPIEGWAWIDNEAIQYTGKSASQLGTISINARGALGTTDKAHEAGAVVYGFNPEVIDRRVELRRVDLADTSNKTLIFKGYIKGFAERGTLIRIVSIASKLLQEKALGSAFARGRLQAVPVWFQVFLADKNNRFPTPINGKPQFFKIGEEVVGYTNILYPFTSAQLTGTPSNNYQVEVFTNHFFQVGDTFDFVDGSGDVVDGGEGAQITKIERVSGDDVVTHTGQILSPLTSGYSMYANYKMALLNPIRGMFETTIESHNPGAEVQEVRVLEGNQLDILFWMLFSVDGNGSNGPNGGVWDTLPSGWGLGLTANDVDYEAFEKVRHRTDYRRYVLDEAIELGKWLAAFSITTNSAVFVTPAGKLTCVPFRDIFPGEMADHTITISNATQILGFSLDKSTVANYAIIRANWGFDGTFHFQTIVSEAESVTRHGPRNLFAEVEDKGISSIGGIPALVAQVEAHLLFRSRPLAIISARVQYVVGSVPSPGQTIRLTFANIPNLKGLNGYSGALFYVLDSRPNVNSGIVELNLIERPETLNLARVAPSAVVDSKSGSDVVLKAASVSHFSPSVPEYEPASGEAGDDDVDWFQVDDLITFWDASTMGNATPTTANATVTGVDYATRTLTVSAVPAWLADGDFVRASDWSTVTGGSNAEDWQDVFLALADDSNPPVLGVSDEAYKWGNG